MSSVAVANPTKRASGGSFLLRILVRRMCLRSKIFLLSKSRLRR